MPRCTTPEIEPEIEHDRRWPSWGVGVMRLYAHQGSADIHDSAGDSVRITP